MINDFHLDSTIKGERCYNCKDCVRLKELERNKNKFTKYTGKQNMCQTKIRSVNKGGFSFFNLKFLLLFLVFKII